MKKKLLMIILIIIILLIVIIWNKYRYDINLYIDQVKSGDEYGIEKMVTVKAHDFINRLSYCYNNNSSIDKVDNYFDKNCEIDLLNSKYIFSNDIRSQLKNRFKQRRDNPDQHSMLIIKHIESEATINNFTQDEVNIKVNGTLKVLSMSDHFFNDDEETEEISYEYIVTFEKKFLFIWKAIKFKTQSSIIKKLLIGNF